MNRKFNYSLVCKLLVSVVCCQFLMMFMFIMFTAMYYRANFYNNNYQTNTQIVNIDNTPKFDKIDINTCSYEALDSLEGIGVVRATKIINNRPYKDIYQIRRLVGETTFNKIKDKIKVGVVDE